MEFTTSVYIVILGMMISIGASIAAPLILLRRPEKMQQVLIGAPVAIGIAGLMATWAARGAILDVNKILEQLSMQKIAATEYAVIVAVLPVLASVCIVSKSAFAIKWFLPVLLGLQGLLVLGLMTDDVRILGITVDFAGSIIDDVGDEKWKQISDIIKSNEPKSGERIKEILDQTDAKKDVAKFTDQVKDMNISMDNFSPRPSAILSAIGIVVVLAVAVGARVAWSRVLPLKKMPL